MKRFALFGLALLAVSVTLAGAASARGRGGSEGVTRPVLFLTPSTAWDYGKGFQDQQGMDAHRTYWKAQHEAGKIFFGGRFADNKGAMIVPTEGVGRRELEKLGAGDPAVKAALLRAEVREIIVDWLPPPPPADEDDDLDDL